MNIFSIIPKGNIRLKVFYILQAKQTYKLKVSCKYLRDIFEKGKDVENLNNAVAASQYAHCRIGLARKFLMQENHCYLMLNGLFLY